MRGTLEKITQHVGTIHGHGVSNELYTREKTVVLPPKHSPETLAQHAADELARRAMHDRLKVAKEIAIAALKKKAADDGDIDAGIRAAEIENDLEMAERALTKELPIDMTTDEKAEYDSGWKTYKERKLSLEK